MSQTLFHLFMNIFLFSKLSYIFCSLFRTVKKIIYAFFTVLFSSRSIYFKTSKTKRINKLNWDALFFSYKCARSGTKSDNWSVFSYIIGTSGSCQVLSGCISLIHLNPKILSHLISCIAYDDCMPVFQ